MRDMATMTVLALLFAICVGMLVRSLILQAEREQAPQVWVVTIQYVHPAKEAAQ